MKLVASIKSHKDWVTHVKIITKHDLISPGEWNLDELSDNASYSEMMDKAKIALNRLKSGETYEVNTELKYEKLDQDEISKDFADESSDSDSVSEFEEIDNISCIISASIDGSMYVWTPYGECIGELDSRPHSHDIESVSWDIPINVELRKQQKEAFAKRLLKCLKLPT